MNDIKLIFIPLNIANVHWILVAVDTEKGSVQICDSMRSTAVTEREETVNHVLQELEKNLKSKWKISTFECTMMEVSQQGNGFDCGFRVLMSIEGYGDDIYHITEENTFEYRRKLFKELYFHEENRAVHPKHSNEKHDYDRENGEEEQDKASKPEKTKAGQNKIRRKTAKTVTTAKGDREADHGIGLRSRAKKVNYAELASGDDPAQAKKKGRGGSSASTKKNEAENRSPKQWMQHSLGYAVFKNIKKGFESFQRIKYMEDGNAAHFFLLVSKPVPLIA